jgi:hypothetical protein
MPAADVVLTVAESKRLIARAVPLVEVVKQAFAEGTIVVGRGTTCGCVAEELLGERIRRASYVLGRVTPTAYVEPAGVFDASLPEVVLRQGRRVEGVTLAEALADLKPGDVVIKGANALDYRSGLAANLIGHPSGGTMGQVLAAVHGKGAHLVVPVGLEKLVAGDLLAAVRRADDAHADTSLPRFWVFRGHIVTEIEALALLCGVDAVHLSSGGICGAEGAVWLRCFGTSQQVAAALALAEELRGEPSFMDACVRPSGSEGGEDAHGA